MLGFGPHLFNLLVKLVFSETFASVCVNINPFCITKTKFARKANFINKSSYLDHCLGGLKCPNSMAKALFAVPTHGG